MSDLPICYRRPQQSGCRWEDETHDSMPRGKSWLMAIVALKFFLLSLQTSSLPRWGALSGDKQQHVGQKVASWTRRVCPAGWCAGTLKCVSYCSIRSCVPELSVGKSVSSKQSPDQSADKQQAWAVQINILCHWNSDFRVLMSSNWCTAGCILCGDHDITDKCDVYIFTEIIVIN